MPTLQAERVADRDEVRGPVPDRMTAVVLDSYAGVEALRIEPRPVPEPGRDEVLVKVAASPINPSDLAVLEGHYGFETPPPVVPGGEGSGTVVAVGPGMVGRYFLGKRVACLNQGKGDGMWAEYVVTTAKGGVLPLHRSVSLEQGATSIINPLTACAFLEIATAGGHRAVALTAAASSLGQMVNRLFRHQGIQAINIVRREAQVDLLEQQGATVVLNSSEADFEQRLHDACHEHDCHLAFDAVAGAMTGHLLRALPDHSRVRIYSALSREAAEVDPGLVIFEDKGIDSFWLGPWMAGKNLIEILRMWRRAQRLLASDLRSEIRAEYPLADVKRAVEDYLGQMTGGKVLLRPG